MEEILYMVRCEYMAWIFRNNPGSISRTSFPSIECIGSMVIEPSQRHSMLDQIIHKVKTGFGRSLLKVETNTEN